MLRVRPVELSVEIVEATPKFDSSPDRYMIAARVIDPLRRKDEILHLLVDGITDEHLAFTTVGSHWEISCDEEAFSHEEKIGFSFWSFRDLKPTKQPNQPPETRPTSRPVSA